MRWDPHPDAAFTRTLLEEWAAGYEKDDYYSWAIQRKEDGELIGSIGILYSDNDDAPHGFEPGYCIGRAFWGNGYAAEALQAALEYFVASTGITTLYACHAKQNPASGRVMEKAGFVYEHDGVYHNHKGVSIPAHYYKYTHTDAKDTHG